jgi:arsenate reductase
MAGVALTDEGKSCSALASRYHLLYTEQEASDITGFLRGADMKQRVLFICTHNSARSQMAEGLLSSLGGDPFEAYSAGTEATHIRPLAMRAMAEIGMDITGQSSKTLDRYLHEPFDEVITVCDAAAEVCPVFPHAKQQRHWSFPDPSKATGSEEEQLAVYRSVRDAIRKRIEAELLTTGQPEKDDIPD